MNLKHIIRAAWAMLVVVVPARGAQESAVLQYDAAGRLVRITRTAEGTNTTEYFEYNLAGDLTFESRYAPGSESADYDGDDMTDATELLDFGTLAQGAQDDFDGDRFANLSEYLAGTSPTNPASYLGLETMSRSGTGIVIRWASVGGKQYRVTRATNLPQNVWSPILTNIPAVPPMNTATDTTAVGSGLWMYRIELE